MQDRVRRLNQVPPHEGPIVYWMIREQRAHDNWALLYAQHIAIQRKQPLYVVFCCRTDLDKYLGTTRMLDWMLRGLEEVSQELEKHHINFTFLLGDPPTEVKKFCTHISAGEVVVDFFPLRPYTTWHQEISQTELYAVTQVDAHNIVPCWVASTKQEFAARTIRPKITRLLPNYLLAFPKLNEHPFPAPESHTNWKTVHSKIKVDTSVPALTWIEPGAQAALDQLKTFVSQRLPAYAEDRNDPNKQALSLLSPYLHFGQIAPQRVAFEVSQNVNHTKNSESFLEELIIRRELSDNYCFYNSQYDSFAGLPNWAQETLDAHRADERTIHYTVEEFETAHTHDEIWNAAQQEMLQTGKMHGYMRMYWVKKILEWTKDPEEAQKTALHLNDTYSIDGRDPNGYVGVAWSIGGLHDRPWFERPIFGTIRFMSASGLHKKFNTAAYVTKWQTLTLD